MVVKFRSSEKSMNISLVLATKSKNLIEQAPLLCQEYIKDEYDACIVDMSSKRSRKEDGITIFGAYAGMLHILLRAKIQIVHVLGQRSGLFVKLLSVLRPNVRIIATIDSVHDFREMRSGIRRAFMSLSEKWTLRCAHRIIATNPLLETMLHGKQIDIIPNTVLPKRAACDPVLLQCYGINSAQYVLAYLHTDDKERYDHLMKAWKNLENDAKGACKLAIVFMGSEKPVMPIVKDESIRYFSNIKGDVLASMQMGARCVIILDESNGALPLLERSWSFGKMVIASDSVTDNEYAIQYASGSVDQLAECMRAVLSGQSITDTAGHRARVFVETYQHPHVIAHAYTGMYERLLIDLHGDVAMRI